LFDASGEKVTFVFFNVNMSTKMEFYNKYNVVVERGITAESQIYVAYVTTKYVYINICFFYMGLLNNHE